MSGIRWWRWTVMVVSFGVASPIGIFAYPFVNWRCWTASRVRIRYSHPRGWYFVLGVTVGWLLVVVRSVIGFARPRWISAAGPVVVSVVVAPGVAAVAIA